MKKQPLLTNNKSNVQMAIFEHTNEEGVTWFSTMIKRPYRDRNGQWQHGSLNREQLAALVELAQDAIRFMDSREHADTVNA